MNDTANLWVLVLGAGEGRRLSELTTDSRGVTTPKQYCSFGRDRPMIQWALDRAMSIVSPERIVTIVAREHRTWWQRELGMLPPANVIVQPRNRGTAAGILLPLIEILKRDPNATIVVLPSDHYVEDEDALSRAIDEATDAVEASPDRLLLLGMTPDGAETEYGWIVPGHGRERTRAVKRFVEKPDAALASELLSEGAVWNSFVLVAAGRTLLHLYGEALPEILEPFLRDLVVAQREGAIEELYASVPTKDFSRDLLECVSHRLALVVVSPCGWTDLGTPVRLRRFLDHTATRSRVPRSMAVTA